MAALFQIIQCRTSVARSFWIIDRLSKLCVRLIWIMWAPQASAAFRIPRRPAWRIDSSGNRRTVAALLDSACPLLGVVRSKSSLRPPLQANASRPTIRRPMSRAPALVGRPRTQSETPHQKWINCLGKAMIAIIRIEEPGLTQQGAHQAAVQGRRRSRYPIDWPIRASRAASSNGITEFAALEKAIRLSLPVPNGRATMDVRLRGGSVTRTR